MPQSHNLIAAFNEEREAVSAIVRNGIGKYALSLPGIDEITQLDDRIWRCMDSRTSGGLRFPPFIRKQDRAKSIRFAVEFGRKAKVSAVGHHLDCGAVGAYLEANSIKPTPQKPPFEYGREFAQDVADEVQVPCIEIPLQGEVGCHRERAVYYTSIDLDPSKEKRLPTGFVINREYTDAEHALIALRVALQIAFGPHGFGELFSGNQPFLVIVVAATQKEVDSLAQEVSASVARYGDRVKVDGLALSGR